MEENKNSNESTNFIKSFQTLKIEILKEKKILHVQLNRPDRLNALNDTLFTEIHKLFSNMHLITTSEDIRVIVISGNGKAFTSGLDLNSNIAQNILTIKSNTEIDSGRKAFFLYMEIKKLQDSLTAIESCHLPTIAAIHGFCLGGGVSLLGCIDIKIAHKNAKFSIKEVDIGLTADLGALQRLVKQTGKEGLIKKYSLTGEIFTAEDALKAGIIEEVVEKEEDALKTAFSLGERIAEKSPVVTWGVKRMINYSRDNSVASSLDMVATLNSALIQSDDIVETLQNILLKKKAAYPKL